MLRVGSTASSPCFSIASAAVVTSLPRVSITLADERAISLPKNLSTKSLSAKAIALCSTAVLLAASIFEPDLAAPLTSLAKSSLFKNNFLVSATLPAKIISR